MSSDLRERLSDLAAHTPPGAPPPDLWDRGVRHRRGTLVGRALVAAVLVVLVGLGGWAWHSDREVQPANPQGSAHLPDRFFFDVSPWTHLFNGAPGPLVTVFPRTRETLTHTENGIIGVTASSGSYGFLDLPRDAVQSELTGNALALAPDGRRLAFWVTGTPSGTPNTVDNDGVTITGVGVYDTVTGAVRESRVATVHGLAPGLLLWTDDTSLAIGYGQILAGDGSENSTTSRSAPPEIWNVREPHPVPLGGGTVPLGADPSSLSTRATRATMILPGEKADSWVTVDPERPASTVTFRTDRASDVLVLSPDHRRAIGVVGTEHSNTGSLAVATLPAGAASGTETHLRRLPLGDGWVRPLAWVDRDHVAVSRQMIVRDPELGPYVSGRVMLVDLRTGGTKPLVSQVASHDTNDSDPWVATDFYGAPVVHAVPPPSPPNLRHWVVGLGVVALIGVLLLAAAISVRRGRRA